MRYTLRGAAVVAFGGAILLFGGTILHPSGADPNDAVVRVETLKPGLHALFAAGGCQSTGAKTGHLYGVSQEFDGHVGRHMPAQPAASSAAATMGDATKRMSRKRERGLTNGRISERPSQRWGRP